MIGATGELHRERVRFETGLKIQRRESGTGERKQHFGNVGGRAEFARDILQRKNHGRRLCRFVRYQTVCASKPRDFRRAAAINHRADREFIERNDALIFDQHIFQWRVPARLQIRRGRKKTFCDSAEFFRAIGQHPDTTHAKRANWEPTRPACEFGRRARTFVTQIVQNFWRRKICVLRFSARRRKWHAGRVRSQRLGAQCFGKLPRKTFVKKFSLVVKQSAERGQAAESARATGGGMLIEQQRFCARARGGNGGGDSRRAAADHRDVEGFLHGFNKRSRRFAANTFASAAEKCGSRCRTVKRSVP